MNLAVVPLRPIEVGYLHVTRISAALNWLITTGVLTVGGIILSQYIDIPSFWVAVPCAAGLFGLWTVFIAVPRRWARWGWAWTGRELHVASGWLTRYHSIVPAARVQHIDVSQGMLERHFGVATLALHTAGWGAAGVTLRGITREQAEEIRDTIRAQLSVDPW